MRDIINVSNCCKLGSKIKRLRLASIDDPEVMSKDLWEIGVH